VEDANFDFAAIEAATADAAATATATAASC
jgi:hypothetical protein